MRPLLPFLTALLLSTATQPLLAADSAAIRQAVDEFLSLQIKDLPGKATYVIGNIDANRLPGACKGFDVSKGNGTRPWGRIQIAVRCRDGAWQIWVPVHIRVIAEYVVIARPINAGQSLTEADLRMQQGELSDLPNGVLMDKGQAVGRVAMTPLPAGRPLRGDMLRQPTVVQQGQSVKIVGSGAGFQVSNEGRALTSAVVGQVLQVRLNSGQILSGVVRADGAVEIRF